MALGVDVRSRSEVHDSVTEVASRFGHVDVMANIAGISSVDAVVDATEEDVEEMIRVTVMGVYFGCQAAARVMVAQRSGSIINMSSTAIDVPTRGLGIYSACKAAVAMLSKVLAVEVGEYGVRVNAVAPGFVPTPMTTSHAWHERTVEEMKARSALQDIPTPDDVADLFLHLASDSSRMITGQTLRVNAGASMPW